MPKSPTDTTHSGSPTGPDAGAEGTSGEPHPTGMRQCGRCRGWFEGEPGAPVVAHPDWWVCDPCRESLFTKPAR